LFATGVNDTSGKFAACVVYTGGNFPPTLVTPVAKMVDKIAVGIVDTSGKFVSVLLIPVVHLDLH
jgi:hypothetical protein